MFRLYTFLAAAFLLLSGQPAMAAPLKLMAFGDSLVHGYGLPAEESFPAQLEAALQERGWQIEVLNAGNSGDTTAAGRARLDWALADDPDLALVVLGGNDLLRGLPPSETRRNLDAILAGLTAAEVPTLLAGMRAPLNLGPDYVTAFDGLYPELAESHGTHFYPHFLEGVATVAALNQNDGIHPNRAGVAHIVEAMLPSVEALLTAAEVPKH